VNPARWRQVEELFLSAAARPPEERVSFLDAACQGDAPLREEIESLLAYGDTPAAFLDQPGWEARDSLPLSPGSMLGPYEILERIGMGGMGEVYKAKDTRLLRIVSVKTCRTNFSERFGREARAIAALNHPHICQIYDVGLNFLVMEYVAGQPIRGPMPLDKALRYATEICGALAAAHKSGIVHRDLKPDNVLLTKSGVKVLDFGLAKTVRSRETGAANITGASPTREGAILGTLHYMAPEQVQGKETDARCDTFSFGCLFYEMLTGRRAFDGPNAATVIAAILEHPAPSIEDVAPAVLNRVLMQCLEKDPEMRWQDARDLGAAISLAADPPPVASPTRRTWMRGAAGLATGALAGAGGLAWFRRRSDDRPRPLRVEIALPPGATFYTQGFARTFALSPDGRNIAYTPALGTRTLIVRSLGGGEPKVVSTAIFGGRGLFWSADGKSIAFDSFGKLIRADLDSGAQWTLCELAEGFAGGSWGPDGRIVLGSDAGLLQLAASGGSAIALTTPDPSRGERSHQWPQILPDGKILYFIATDRPATTGIYVHSPTRPAERKSLLTSDTSALYAPGGNGKDYLLWRRAGALVAQEFDAAALTLRGELHPLARVAADAVVSTNGVLLYSSTRGLSQLTWFDRSGKSLTAVGEPAEYQTFRLSPDGHRLAAARSGPNGDRELWIIESSSGDARKFTDVVLPLAAWSGDGQTLLYTAGPHYDLTTRSLSGKDNARQISQSANVTMPTDWSRDGRFIFYEEFIPGSGGDQLVLELGRNGTPKAARPWLNTASGEVDCHFLPEPNPRWVAYVSNESGQQEIYVDSFSGSRRPRKVSNGGGRYVQWRADGRELFFTSFDNSLMAAEVKAGSESLHIATPKALFTLPVVENSLPPFDVAPDGQRFLVRMKLGEALPLNLIVNWPALLDSPAG
jgi:Tol biopolymer transport system component/predicted Ser/Thr protein kinase